jgi:hypothetical protein
MDNNASLANRLIHHLDKRSIDLIDRTLTQKFTKEVLYETSYKKEATSAEQPAGERPSWAAMFRPLRGKETWQYLALSPHGAARSRQSVGPCISRPNCTQDASSG